MIFGQLNLMSFIGILLTTLISLVIYVSVKRHLIYKKYSHIPGPPIKTIYDFFIGNFSVFREVHEKKKLAVEVLAELAKTYGHVFKINIYGLVMVSISDPDGIRKVLVEKDFPKFEKAIDFLSNPFGKRFMGKGLVTESNIEAWRSKRNTFNGFFHRQKLMNYMNDFNTQGDLLMEKLRSLADGISYMPLFDQLNRATLDVIANIAFGLNFNSLNDPNCELNYYIGHSLESVTAVANEQFIALSPQGQKRIRNYKKSIEKLRQIAKEQIQSKIKEMETDGVTGSDIFSIILSENKNKLDLEELVDDFITFFIAGQETTSNAIAFSLMELGRNPEKLKKLRDEVDRVLGAKSEITHDDLNKLEYTSCIFKEAMRKWPPAHSQFRFSTEDITVCGYHVPKGTWIQCSTYVNGRLDEFFPNPEEFIPERFLKDPKLPEENKFSMGSRNCIGQNFAQIEGKVLLAKFVQNFDFELDPHQSFRPVEATTMKPKDGCRAKLTLKK